MTANTLSLLRSIAPYLTQWVTYQAGYRGATGLQLAVRYQDEPVLDLAWGRANIMTGEELTCDHLFRVASHSKTMTAVIVMRLVEDGDLRLDDIVGEIVSELADTAIGSVTVRELLGHQGGIVRDSSAGDFWQARRPFPNRDELLQVLYEEGAIFSPNEYFKYSNIAYGLLGYIAELVRRQSYAELAEDIIIRPLQLGRTGPDYEESRAPEYAAGHTGRSHYGAERRVISHLNTRSLAPATGWYSTAAELARCASALAFGNETLISDASKRLMQRKESEIKLSNGAVRHYGLGLEVSKIGDRDLVGHSGGYPGHISRAWIDPEAGLVVSALTNDYDGPADAIVTGVIQLIGLAENAAKEGASEIPADHYVTGRFENLSGVVDIVDLGGVLHVIPPGLPEPGSAHQRLSTRDGQLINEPKSGFAVAGEPVRITRLGQDVESVHLGAKTVWPVDTFRTAMDSLDPQSPIVSLPL